MSQDESRRPVRFDGTVVFADGRTHLVRIYPGGFLQWAADVQQFRDAEAVLRALASAFADASKGSEMTEPDTSRARRLRPNPKSRVDYTAPEVVELVNTPVRDLIDDHNSGRGDRLALLFEIADEEGWL